jgi:Mlc titration factor MtfA (ptsG expression regulator)
MYFEMIFTICMCVCLLAFISAFRKLVIEKSQRIKYEQQLAVALPNHLVYNGKNLSFNNADVEGILQKYFPYYKALNFSLQQKFRKRVKEFVRSKVFIIRHYEGFKEMPVLISAAAIQITFGLRNYLLPHFTYIQIHPEEYFAENSLRVLAGNVHRNTITVAWNHFLKGFKEQDGSNVGLHEMAHALYYQHLVADINKQTTFIANFEDVMVKGEETFKECRDLSDRLYSDLAFINMQEFWAESLEIFFEKPTAMEALYPDLFTELCDLLKQNPTYSENPLNMASV